MTPATTPSTETRLAETSSAATRPTSASNDVIRVSVCRDESEWNDYVTKQSRSLFHRWEWNDVFAVYGLPVTRLAAYRGERIVGVLPLVHQRSRLFGNQLVSLPWFDAAGVMADDELESQALVESAVSRCQREKAETVQLRQSQDVGYSRYVRSDKVLMGLNLPPVAEDLWKRLKPKVRNQVRKGEKAGLRVSREEASSSSLKAFYDVYSRNMRDLGSPCHSHDFFECLCGVFSQEVSLWTVTLEGRAVGAGLTMANGDVLEIPWASSLRDYNSLCVNHTLYWNILKSACESGFGRFHFGRSSVDSGTYRFKKQWGAEGAALYWYLLGEDEQAHAAAQIPTEKFGLAQAVWKRLPLSMARRLGPMLIAKLA